MISSKGQTSSSSPSYIITVIHRRTSAEYFCGLYFTLNNVKTAGSHIFECHISSDLIKRKIIIMGEKEYEWMSPHLLFFKIWTHQHSQTHWQPREDLGLTWGVRPGLEPFFSLVDHFKSHNLLAVTTVRNLLRGPEFLMKLKRVSPEQEFTSESQENSPLKRNRILGNSVGPVYRNTQEAVECSLSSVQS